MLDFVDVRTIASIFFGAFAANKIFIRKTRGYVILIHEVQLVSSIPKYDQFGTDVIAAFANGVEGCVRQPSENMEYHRTFARNINNPHWVFCMLDVALTLHCYISY